MLKKMKNAIVFFCLITLFFSLNAQSDGGPEPNTNNMNQKFRDTCNPEKYTKYVKKYIVDVDDGNYLSKLWDYNSKAVIDY